ncbi:MAG: hypothetical protein E7599_00020 [Ruminococcaceae bacterium]|nr:hypothetical protein [Oscillospiraceae bacterium]
MKRCGPPCFSLFYDMQKAPVACPFGGSLRAL